MFINEVKKHTFLQNITTTRKETRDVDITVYISSVSNNVTDVVMSSLKTCNLWKGRGKVGSKGWAVDHQPGMSVDGHSHHDHQKGDSKKVKRVVHTQRNGKQGQRGAKAN